MKINENLFLDGLAGKRRETFGTSRIYEMWNDPVKANPQDSFCAKQPVLASEKTILAHQIFFFFNSPEFTPQAFCLLSINIFIDFDLYFKHKHVYSTSAYTYYVNSHVFKSHDVV